jgi:hypothetical protein
MSVGVLALVLAWKFIAPDAGQVVAMEWRRVLDSPLSAEVRREIPPGAIPALAGINFIEGIERVVWTPGLIVLEGSFDVNRLKDMAVSDGGVVTPYRNAELVQPTEKGGSVISLTPSVVLLGSGDLIRAAIDRAEKSKATGPTGFDLWTRTTGKEYVKHEFGVRLGERIHVSSTIRYASEDSARGAASHAQELKMAASAKGVETSISAMLLPDEFRARQWRSTIETLTTASVKPPQAPGMIRIYGLEEGVKEIPLK